MYEKFKALQEHASDPALTMLVLLQSLVIFGLGPIMSAGIALPPGVFAATTLCAALLAVIVSPRLIPTIVVVVAISVSLVTMLIREEDNTLLTDCLGAAAGVMALGAVSWVVAERVFAPGRMSAHRVIGAVALYLNVALLFVSLYRLVAELSPGAYAGIPGDLKHPRVLGDLVYFSLATLTTVGYGDIAPVNPAARSLSNLEGVLGQLYPAIVLARIVTLYEPKK